MKKSKDRSGGHPWHRFYFKFMRKDEIVEDRRRGRGIRRNHESERMVYI